MNIGFLLVLFSGVLFGSAGVLAKYMIGAYAFTPIAIAATRLIISAPSLLLVLALTKQEKVPVKKEHIWLFLLGGVTAAAYQLVFFFAVNRVLVSIATLLSLCTNPLFVALFSAIFFKEKIKPLTLVALVLSIGGTALIIGRETGSLSGGGSALGYLLAVLAGFVFAVYTFCNKLLLQSYPPAKVTAYNFTLGALFISPFAALPANLPARAWVLMAVLGVVFTALGYTCFSLGLRRATATHASIGSLFEPLTSTVLSVLLLREAYVPTQIIGGVLLCVSLLLLLFQTPISRAIASRFGKPDGGTAHDQPQVTDRV